MTMLRRLGIVLALALIAVPLQAQESLRQQRQRAGWAIAQAQNSIEALQAMIAHLEVLMASQTTMILEGAPVDTVFVTDTVFVGEEPQPDPEPDPEPEPEPEPEPDPDPQPDPDPSGDAVDFATTWGAMTGNTNAAVFDAASATPWDEYFTGAQDGSRLLEVVPASTAEARCGDGWPTRNALEVSFQEPWAMQIQVEPNVQYAPGDTIYIRAYTCNATPAGQGNATSHWMHWHLDPYVLWWEDAPGNSAGLTTRLYDGIGQTTFGNHMNQPSTNSTFLTTNTIYRHELAIVMESNRVFRPNYRVYDADGALVLSGVDLRDNWGEGPPSDSVGSRSATISGVLVDACAFQIGNNDNRPQNPNANRYIGAFACRVGGGWLGAWPATGEGN